MTNALVIGGVGMLGSHLITRLQGHYAEIHATSRRHTVPSQPHDVVWHSVDLGSTLVLPQINDLRTVFLIAAVTKVVDCEANPQDTWRINADAPAQFALQAAKKGAHVVFVSSDAVDRAPALNYSRQKAYAEQVVYAVGGTVIRPSRIPVERATELCDLLISVAHSETGGLIRWQ